MFGSPFNRCLFNRPYVPLNDLSHRIIAAERLNALFTVGINGPLFLAPAAALHGGTVLTAALSQPFEAQSALSCAVVLFGSFSERAAFLTALQSELVLLKNLSLRPSLFSDLCAAPILCKNLSQQQLAAAAMAGDTVFGKNSVLSLGTAAHLLCTCGVTDLETVDLYLDVVIPPGGVLTLDTERLRLLLDGQNMLWLHSGDWPLLSRNALYLDLDCGSGSLTGTLTATPRYL